MNDRPTPARTAGCERQGTRRVRLMTEHSKLSPSDWQAHEARGCVGHNGKACGHRRRHQVPTCRGDSERSAVPRCTPHAVHLRRTSRRARRPDVAIAGSGLPGRDRHPAVAGDPRVRRQRGTAVHSAPGRRLARGSSLGRHPRRRSGASSGTRGRSPPTLGCRPWIRRSVRRSGQRAGAHPGTHTPRRSRAGQHRPPRRMVGSSPGAADRGRVPLHGGGSPTAAYGGGSRPERAPHSTTKGSGLVLQQRIVS